MRWVAGFERRWGGEGGYFVGRRKKKKKKKKKKKVGCGGSWSQRDRMIEEEEELGQNWG